MPGRVLFKEDFFERAIDVNWESEPKVYWMAGSGSPLIINSQVTGGGRAGLFTSDDGINWRTEDIGIRSGVGQWGYGALYAGAWLRNGLMEGGDPSWVMVGSDGRTTSGSGSVASSNGTAIDTQTYFDDKHSGSEIGINSQPGVSSSGDIYCISQFNYPDWHQDRFKSSNGRKWNPARYHGEDGGGGFGGGGEGFAAARQQQVAAAPPTAGSPILRVTAPSLEAYQNSLLVPEPQQLLAESQQLLVPEQFATSPAEKQKADKIVWIPARHIATGRVKKGRYAGKTLTVEISPYDFQPPAHGRATVKIKDAETGKSLGTANTGIQRTITIGYGHYVFVIGGSSGSAGPGGGDYYIGKSTIAHSEDGLEWKVVELGNLDQINPIVVGPRE